MKLRKAIRKIAALGVGAAFVGSTIMGAMALDLNEYPAPFIADGAFSGVLVVGDSAKAEDVIGVTDIATSLQYTTSTGGGNGVTIAVEGDAFKISKGGDSLNMWEYLSSAAGGSDDQATGPIESVTETDLNSLAGGTITNEKGTYNYDQYITLAQNASVVYEVDSDTSDDPDVYLKFFSDYSVYKYQISFPAAIKTDCDSNDDFEDLDNKKITLLGKEYTIINTDNSTGTLDLMGGAVQDTLEEGETKTYTINDKEYEVTVPIITDTGTVYAKFVINGETTEALEATKTFKLADGTEIGVKEILPNEAGDVSQDMVEFYLGAQKVSFKDSDFTSGQAGTLEVGGTEISDVTVDLVGSNAACSTSTEASISKIEIEYNASDDIYVPVGGKYSEQLDEDSKGKLFLENIDYEFAALNVGATETIKVSPSSNDKYKVTMPTKTDGEISFYAFYSNSEGNITLGKDATHQIVFTGNAVGEHDFFAVSSNKYSHLIEVTDVSSTSTATKVTLKPVGGQSFKVENSTGATTDFYLDGFKYTYAANTGAKTIVISDDGTDASDMGSSIILYTPSEAKVNLTIMDNETVRTGSSTNYGDEGLIQFTEYHKGKEDDSSEIDHINISIYDQDTTTTDSNKITAGTPASTSVEYASVPTGSGTFSMLSWDSKNNFYSEMTKWGTLVEHETPTDGQNTVTITYPEDEVTADVYLTSGVVKIETAGGTGGSESVTVSKIEVGATKLASEVTDVTAQNVIAVGGPCANSVAAAVMGNPADCTAGFEAGKGRILLFENGENVAMVVAGFSAMDTRNAAQVIANYQDYALDGTAMEVTKVGTTLTVAEEEEPVLTEEEEEAVEDIAEDVMEDEE